MKEKKPVFSLRGRGKEGAYRAPDLIKIDSVVLEQCFPFFFTAWSLRISELLGFSDSTCLLYTSPSPRDVEESRMPSSA